MEKVYLARPEIRPPTFRPQFFNRLPRLLGMEKHYRPPEYEVGGFMGFLHTALDVVGFVPGVGEIADGVNAPCTRWKAIGQTPRSTRARCSSRPPASS